jgi:hypothetical protein
MTLDAMRLARNHPALTNNDWFETILFADRLGHKGLRAPGEMGPLIAQALAHRNYRFDHGSPANLKVVSENGELTNLTKGSRYNPYVHALKSGETASHDITISLTNSDSYKFIFPVTIEVQFNGGPLQGAVKWADEAAGPKTFILNSEADVAKLTLTALSGCDSVNRQDGSCQDFAYILVKNAGETRPVAKKRFYLRISNADAAAPKQARR